MGALARERSWPKRHFRYGKVHRDGEPSPRLNDRWRYGFSDISFLITAHRSQLTRRDAAVRHVFSRLITFFASKVSMTKNAYCATRDVLFSILKYFA